MDSLKHAGIESRLAPTMNPLKDLAVICHFISSRGFSFNCEDSTGLM